MTRNERLDAMTEDNKQSDIPKNLESRVAAEKLWLDKLASAARMYKQSESAETRAELRFAYRDVLLAIAMDAP